LGLQSFQLCVSGLKISAREKSIQEVVGDEPLGQLPCVNFVNVLQAAFAHKDPKSTIKTDNLTVFFVLSGSARLKAARRMLMKSTPCLQQQKKIGKWTLLIVSKRPQVLEDIGTTIRLRLLCITCCCCC